MKIVINARHGGFGLSNWGVEEYARRAGLVLHVHEPDSLMGVSMQRLTGSKDYWLVPQDQRPATPEPWHEQPIEARKAHNEEWSRLNFSSRDLKRDDPILVAVVEEDAERASAKFAALKVVEIPDDVEWEIDEYDGAEWVSEKHRRWS
jgi:hypothetical protein